MQNPITIKFENIRIYKRVELGITVTSQDMLINNVKCFTGNIQINARKSI